MNNRKFRITALVAGVSLIAGCLASIFFFGGRKTEAQPAPVVVPAAPGLPVSNVVFGKTYEFTKIEPVGHEACPNGTRIDFAFADHNVLPQSVCETDINDHSTEIRRLRKVNPTLVYSRVTFYQMFDPSIEGMRASNIVVTKYVLNLRRSLVPVRTPRPGRAIRQ